ncbi:hypothetical protein BTVI_157135 [Pitangus sulphuratus]|nr:hypothetical protein BTVI_157135 [Pitangus sulphuratus]
MESGCMWRVTEAIIERQGGSSQFAEQKSIQLALDITEQEKRTMLYLYTDSWVKRVKDVISPIVFEAAYSLQEHVIGRGKEDKELPALKPILRWKKGQKIAQRNQFKAVSSGPVTRCLGEETKTHLATTSFQEENDKTVFERNCQSDDCAADLKLQGKLLLSSVDDRTAYLALGAVRNISLNIFISNIGDDAYDTNVFFNFSGELFFIKMWQKEELGIACELLESDFLKCSVGFPFMRSNSRYEFSVIFDTSHLSGQEEMLTFLVTAQSGNLERTESLHDNILTLSIPLMHEVASSISGFFINLTLYPLLLDALI